MYTISANDGTAVDDVPAFEDLTPLGEFARRLKVSISTIHRWRMHPTTALRCWRMGRDWYTTEDAVRDFIRRQTAAATPGGDRDASPAPVHSAKRRKQIEAAVEQCKAMGC